MDKPNVLFFSRNYQSTFFPNLKSSYYNSYHVTLTVKEKNNVQCRGGVVVGCLEEEYFLIKPSEIEFPYLTYSFGADRFIRGYNYDERICILKIIIQFWKNILEKYKPICVINEPVAIEVSEVLMIEAKRLNIEYLTLGSFFVDNSFYIYYYSVGRKSFSKVLNKVLPNEKDFTDAHHIVNQIKNGYKPIYIKNLDSRKSIKKLLKIMKGIAQNIYIRLIVPKKVIRQVCYGSSLRPLFWQLKLYIRSLIYNTLYDEVDTISRNDVEYILYPLHLEPEAVLFYGATFYDNQAYFIENTLKCLKENQVLIVKEHPQQSGYLLQNIFKILKRRFPNVLYVKSEENVHKILQISSIIITLGGSTGFEALIFGKTVINFGRVFYDSFEDVVNMYSFEDLYKYLRGNMSKNNSHSIEVFTAKIVHILKKGNPFPGKNLYKKENIEAVMTAIADEVKKLNVNEI